MTFLDLDLDQLRMLWEHMGMYLDDEPRRLRNTTEYQRLHDHLAGVQAKGKESVSIKATIYHYKAKAM